jgi:nucleoside phosphorylase/CheY-like chemotaxis protein
MKVLVVHDRSNVGEDIASLVTDICPNAHVELIGNAASARANLAQNFYDLLILDLTLPTIEGREPNGFQVAEALLEELMELRTLMTPGHVLGITRDKEALDTIQNNIGSHLMSVIAEDEEGRWRKQMGDRLRYVLNSSASRSQAMMTRHDFDLLIITALDKELTPFRDFFGLQDYPPIPGVAEFSFTDKDGYLRRGACYAIGRAGQPSAASDTQGLLCQLRPRLAIMTGFCGGIPGKANLGDVLFAESAIDWDYGKWKPSANISRLYSRPEPIVIRNSRAHRVARVLVEEGLPDANAFEAEVMRLTKREIGAPVLRRVPFASGSAVIGDTDVLSSIKALNEDIGGVDMESFGFYVACNHAHAAPPEFICVKAVADECGPDKDDRLHVGCSYASAFVARVIATRLWDFSPH